MHQINAGIAHVPVFHKPAQGIQHAGFGAQGVVLCKPQLSGQHVRSQKTDAPYIHGQAVGVFLEHIQRFNAVKFIDAHRVRRGDAAWLQKDNELANAVLGAPGLFNAFGHFGADALDLA